MIEIFIGALVPILILILTGVGRLYWREREKLFELKQKTDADKREVYQIFVGTLYDFISPKIDNKGNVVDKNPSDIAKLTQQISMFNKKIFIYGSDEVIKSYQDVQIALRQQPWNFAETVEAVGNMLICIRKDMGWVDTKVTPVDFVRLLLTDYEDNIAVGQPLHAFHRKYQ